MKEVLEDILQQKEQSHQENTVGHKSLWYASSKKSGNNIEIKSQMITNWELGEEIKGSKNIFPALLVVISM